MPGRTAETAKMVAELDLKTQKFTKGVQTAIGSVGKLSGAVARSRAVSVALGVGLERAAETGLRALGGSIKDGLNSLADLEDAALANTAAIKQVGLAGKVTADQIAAWSVEIESSVHSAFDDKEINAAAGTLIRYGKVSASNLKPALVVMTDLAAKTGDVGSASTLLARALADPAKASGKLARAGVILTKAQDDQIKSLVKAGKTAQAQTLLLQILAKTTKGAADASQGPYRRSLNELRDAYEEVTKALAVGFLPIIEKVRGIITTAIAQPGTLARIREFGQTIAEGLGKVVDFATKVDWGSIANRVGHAFGIIATAVSVIKAGWDKIPEPLKNLLIGGIIADRTLKFLINVSPIKLAVDFAANAVAGLIGGMGKAVGTAILGAGLGKFFVQPVFVTNPGFGTGLPGMGGGAPGVGPPVPGWSQTAGGSGGLSGLLKGIPIIGAALAGAEFANIAAPIIAEKLKTVVPEASGDVASGATKAIVGALTGPLGWGNLVSGLQDIAGNLGRLIPLIDAHKPVQPGLGGHDLFNPATGAVPVRTGLGGSDIPAITAAFDHIAAPIQAKLAAIATNILTAGTTRDSETSTAIKDLVSKLPTGKVQDDATFAATIAQNVVDMTPKFVPTVKLDPSQITDLRGLGGGATAGAQRDEETSKSIQSLIAQTDLVARSTDIDQLGAITDSGLSAVDVSTVRGAAQTSSASTQAGFHSAQQTFASGLGIEGAIRANRPIINVDVQISATDITQVNVVEDRGGSRSGSRDGDGGGGPGQG